MKHFVHMSARSDRKEEMVKTSEYFYSEDFDAAAALADPLLIPPVNVKPLESMRHLRFLLPPTHQDYLNVATHEKLKREREQKRKADQFRVIKPPEPMAKDCLGQLAEGCAAECHTLQGLLSWKGQVISVHLRDWGQRKSIIHGTLVSFDRHFNLLIRDAVEVVEATKRQRRLTCSLIKGDSVMLIHLQSSSSSVPTKDV